MMKRKNSVVKGLISLTVSCVLLITKSFGQTPAVSTNDPQTISGSTASLTSNASSGSGIASFKWTKFSVPGQTLKKVTVVGSSTAAGNGASSGSNAFVNKLRSYYQAQGIISDITNLAVAGTTPFDIDINSALNNTTPDVLLVSYPSNGYTASNNSNVMNRYQDIQNACNSRNIQMFVTGTQPRNDFNDADRANLITMNNLLRNAFGDRFIDFLTPLLNTNGNVMKAEYYADGIHPNDAGHEVIYQLTRAANIFRNSISSGSAITSPTSANTGITSLAPGVHRFQIGVLDNGGFAASTFTTITVNAGGNQPPTANAGNAQTITLPVSQVTLTGSGSDPEGGPITYAWTQISGTPATIGSPSSATTTITGLTTSGSRVFRLTVTDNQSATATSDVTVNVITGSSAKTIPGRIEAESWDAKSGYQYTTNTTDAGGGLQVVGISNGSWLDYNVNVTQTGTYKVNFRIATTQSLAQFQIKKGDVILATVNIPNTGGWDTWVTVTSANFNLTAGNQTIRILSTNTESCNFNWMDFIAVAVNQPPTANAGNAQTINLPVSQVTLTGSGSDPEAGPITYAWTQTAGTTATITNPALASTTVTGLTTTGARTFRLTVTDNQGATATSDVIITVNSAQGPTANAGTAQTITLPASQVTLSGSGTAGNGGALSYAWTQVSGTAATITTPGSASTTVTGLTTAGARVFRLTVTQSDNQTATSDVTVTVNPVVVSNGKTIPGRIEAESWDNKSGYQYAVATTDVGGGLKMVGISNGSWMDYNVNVLYTGSYIVGFRVATTQAHAQFQIVSGTTVLATVNLPSTGSWDNWNTVTVTNVALIAGNQVIRILSTNNENCDFNWMEFTLPNPPPVANAGPAQSITLPASQVTLSGTGSATNGGALSYAWTQVSGTAATITTPGSASTSVTGLTTTGARVFRLTVTQSDNQTATSDVTITVNPVVVSNGKTIPGRIEAESWDNKSGYQYAVVTTDVGGGLKMVGISNGSWMDYNVNVLTTGNYTVGFRIATTQAHAQFQILSGATVLATVNLPSTGSWDNWNTITVTNVPLTAGNQTIRILSTNTENCDFNWMEFTLTGSLIAGKTTAIAVTDEAQKTVLPNLPANSMVQIFPNPVQDQFVLRTNNSYTGTVRVQIIDQSGRIRKEVQPFKSKGLDQLSISANGLAQGTYFVKVIMGDFSTTVKIIKL